MFLCHRYRWSRMVILNCWWSALVEKITQRRHVINLFHRATQDHDFNVFLAFFPTNRSFFFAFIILILSSCLYSAILPSFANIPPSSIKIENHSVARNQKRVCRTTIFLASTVVLHKNNANILGEKKKDHFRRISH